ncbi:hypothetical protein V5O48_013286 [Marasmius crinis-equi]|uniref:F-box domain-containing protein n=1 Tax=Marasmius crinis-equi TaxID=585013 RepID=A0ABR3F0H1_9AGAR
MEQLATYQNSKLPYDTLIFIFAFHVKNLLLASSKKIKPHEWLSFTHVCQSWRSAALHSRTLWTEPDLRFPTIAREMLKRSQSLPITLDFSASERARREELALELLKEHLERTAYLSLSLSAPAMDRVLRSAVTPASSLRTLTLSVYGEEATRIVLPNDFLGGTSASLQRLAVHGFFIPWNSAFLILKDLTHFAVTCPIGSTPDLSLSQLAQVLRRCPALELLSLSNCVSLTSEDTPPVELTRLRHVGVGSKMPVLIELMATLKMPPTTSLKLGVVPGESHMLPAEITRLMTLTLGLPESGKPINEVTTLSFAKEEGMFTCLAWDEVINRRFSLSFFYCSQHPPDFEEYVHTFLEAASISNLEMLHLSNVPISSRTVRLLSTLPRLDTVGLSPECASTVIEALAPPVGTAGGGSQEGMPFSSLEVLHLHNVVFGPLPPEIELKSLLYKKLAARREGGVGLLGLRLKSCEGLSEEDIVRLEEIVPVIDGDNFEEL